MKESIKRSKVLRRIIITVIAVVALAGIITLVQALNGGQFDELAYETKSYDRKIEYALEDVLQERGETPVYRVKIGDKTVNVSETIWNTYLGDKFNTITCHEEIIGIYKFRLSGNYDCYTFSRSNYPWEESVQPYSEADAQILLSAIYENGCWDSPFRRGGYLSQSDIAVTFDSSIYSIGAADNPYDGKTAIENPEINWWWNCFD